MDLLIPFFWFQKHGYLSTSLPDPTFSPTTIRLHHRAHPLTRRRSLSRYLNVLGCDRWLYEFGWAKLGAGFTEKARFHRDNCSKPEPYGWIAIAYFVSFAVIGAQVQNRRNNIYPLTPYSLFLLRLPPP